MSYSVNWITKVVSIPTADLTLVSGTRYSLGMVNFLTEIRRLEWAFADGLWAPAIINHTNTRVDFAGANYAPFDDIINAYTIQFTGIATRVDLLGSNNDIIDVLIPTGISVVPSNSAGLQIVDSGGGDGITEEDFHNYMDNYEGKEDYRSDVTGLAKETTSTSIKKETDEIENIGADIAMKLLEAERLKALAEEERKRKEELLAIARNK